MRNRFPGTCYRCGEHCAAGDGHFEKRGRTWCVQHATCAIVHRNLKIERMAHEHEAWDAMDRDRS